MYDRVIPDCNLYAGSHTTVPLRPSMVEYTEFVRDSNLSQQAMFCIYRIPPEDRENKNIVVAISVNWPYTSSGVNATLDPLNVSPLSKPVTLQSIACQNLQSAIGVNGSYKPIPVLMDGDLIKLIPTSNNPLPGFDWILNCRLEYDNEFSNLNRSAIIELTALIEQATKAYIFNTAVLKLDEFAISGGSELGRFKDIVDSYSEAEEKYQELLNSFSYLATTLSPETKAKLMYGAL